MTVRNIRSQHQAAALDAAVEPPRLGIYTRVSDPDEDSNAGSHGFQEEECRVRAAALGYAVHDVYPDNFSGRYLHERPGLSRLRQDVRDGKIQAVMVWKLDRLSRKLAQRAILVQELRDQACKHISATEAISDTPEGRLLEAMLGAIADFEVERTLERSQAGLAVFKKRREAVCGGRARYGYRYNVALRVREVYEAEAEVVRRIFAWYLLGDSSTAIAARLTSLNVPSPNVGRGIKGADAGTGRWNPGTIREFLHDESYCGEPMTQGKKRSTGAVNGSGNARLERTDPSEWWQARAATPAIIDRVTFDRAQELLRGRASYFKARNAEKPYLLRGLVRCAQCGRAMSPQTSYGRGVGKWEYYVCNSAQMGCRCGNKGTPIPWLDGVVWAEVVRLVSDRGAIEERLAQILREDRKDDLDRDLAAHCKATADARAAIRRLMTRLEATDDPELVDPLEARLVELRAAIAAHQAEAGAIESRLAVVRNRTAALGRWLEACERTRERLAGDAMTFEQKRLLLQALDVQVIARKREVTLKLGIPLVNDAGSPWESSETNQLRLTFQFSLTG